MTLMDYIIRQTINIYRAKRGCIHVMPFKAATSSCTFYIAQFDTFMYK